MSGFNTRAIHAGQEPDPATGAVNVPVHLSTTFKQDGVGGLRGGYEYSRSANPTRKALEDALAAIEGGPGRVGAPAVLVAAAQTADAVLLVGRDLVDRRYDRTGEGVRRVARVDGERLEVLTDVPVAHE